MPAPVSQGSTVSFAGTPIGELVGWNLVPATAVTTEITSTDSVYRGSGGLSRVVKEYDCTTVDPGTVSVRLLGCPPYQVEDIGLRGTLVVDFDGGALSAEAILMDFEVEGSVGDLLRGTAKFQFTGAE
jgi:hypothetical protein